MSKCRQPDIHNDKTRQALAGFSQSAPHPTCSILRWIILPLTSSGKLLATQEETIWQPRRIASHGFACERAKTWENQTNGSRVNSPLESFSSANVYLKQFSAMMIHRKARQSVRLRKVLVRLIKCNHDDSPTKRRNRKAPQTFPHKQLKLCVEARKLFIIRSPLNLSVALTSICRRRGRCEGYAVGKEIMCVHY